MQKEASVSPAYTHWKRNLYTISIAQFIVMLGFSFVNPFLPLLVKQMGNYTSQDAAFLGGLATGANGLAMFFTAPLWGILADRVGRKPMLLRAQFGSALVVALMGFVPNIPILIVLRLIQGTLSGTVAAASALVAGTTPRDKLPFAMGLFMVAVFGGQSFGPILGGFVADVFGYRAAFLMTTILLSIGGLMILFFVHEEFERRGKTQATSLASIWRLAISRQQIPLLAAIFALNAGPQMIAPIIPLLCSEMETSGMPATASGLAFCLMGVVASGSSLITGRIGERFGLKNLLVVSCIGTGLLYLPPILATTVAQLVILVAITGLPKGGSITSSTTLVGLSASSTQQGVAYGIAQSARALGSGLGPLMGGGLATLLGLRPTFAVTGGLFMLVGLLGFRLLRVHTPQKSPPQTDIPNASRQE